MKKVMRFRWIIALTSMSLLWSACVKRVDYIEEDICATMTCRMDSVYSLCTNYSPILPQNTTNMTQVNFNEVSLNTILASGQPQTQISLFAEHNCLSGVVMFEFASIQNDIRIKAFAQNIEPDTLNGIAECPKQIVEMQTDMPMPALSPGKYNLTFKNKVGPDIRHTLVIN